MELCHCWQGDAVTPTHFSTCDSGCGAAAQPHGLLGKKIRTLSKVLWEAAALISSHRAGAASGTCPPAGCLQHRSLEVIGFGAATTFHTHFPPPSGLAALPVPSLPRHQHLCEAMRLATSHPSTTALFSCQGGLPEEDDFPP